MKIVIMFTNGIMDGMELTATDNGDDDSLIDVFRYGTDDERRAFCIYRDSGGKAGNRFLIAPSKIKTFPKYPFHLSICRDLRAVCTADYEFRRDYEYEIAERLEVDDEVLIHAIATGRVVNSSVVTARYASAVENATFMDIVENP
jgi:hypothetical protein